MENLKEFLKFRKLKDFPEDVKTDEEKLKFVVEIVEEMFNDAEDEDQDYEGDNIVQGFLILMKYFNIKKVSIIDDYEFDGIYTIPIKDVLNKGITYRDIRKLIRLGWGLDDCTYEWLVAR